MGGGFKIGAAYIRVSTVEQTELYRFYKRYTSRRKKPVLASMVARAFVISACLGCRGCCRRFQGFCCCKDHRHPLAVL